jgi:PAS domain S-box-containing protein
MKLRGWIAALFEHGIPVLFAALAVVMLVATPVWAYQWYHDPFIGALLEPNNVVSQINGNGWPARHNGVNWSDRLVAVAGQPVADVRQVRGALAPKQVGDRVSLTFARQPGGQFEVSVGLTRPHFSDLLSLFVIPYVVGLVFLGIGLWVYRIRPDLQASRAFLVFTAALAMLTCTFLDMNTTHNVVLLWSLSLPAAAGALGHMALVFPQPMPFVERRPALRYLPWLFSLTAGYFITRDILAPADPYGYILSWRWGGYFLMALAIAFFFATLIVRIVRSGSAIVRQQSRVIILGSVLALFPILLFYLLPSTVGGQVPEFRSEIYFPLLILLPLSVAYAIIRYRLLDVDRILGRLVTYLLTTAAAFAVFYGLIALISFLIQSTIQPNDPMLIAGYILLLMLGLGPLRGLMQRLIDRLFYRAPADYRRVLTDLSRNLAVTPNLTQTLRLLETQLSHALAPEKFVIYLYNDELGEYFPHATREDSAPAYHAEEPIIHELEKALGPVWFPPNGPAPFSLDTLPLAYERLAGSVFVPLHYEEKLIGFMLLGPRRSGDLYNSDDLDFLAAVAAQSTLALENARLFTNLRHTLDQTREMKNLMDDIFSSVATGIITTDLHRQITLFNHAAEQILGVELDDVIGRPIQEALPALDEYAAGIVERGDQLLSTEINPHVGPRGDLYLRLSCSPLKDAYLETKGATIVFEDLTTQRKVEAERELIRQTFGRVVAPRVRDRLLAGAGNLRLTGTKQMVTILFADLQGFTPFSEKHPPETVFRVLNSYLSLAAQAILEQEGTLDKFIGDAVLAIWNSPDQQSDHALRAVRAAQAIMQRAQEAHHRFNDASLQLTFRIGIATGPAMIGNVGTNDLFNYTAIGDTVNIAQRLQVSAQAGQVLLQKSTYDIVAGHVVATRLDPIAVKGREQPVEIYELVGLRG